MRQSEISAENKVAREPERTHSFITGLRSFAASIVGVAQNYFTMKQFDQLKITAYSLAFGSLCKFEYSFALKQRCGETFESACGFVANYNGGREYYIAPRKQSCWRDFLLLPATHISACAHCCGSLNLFLQSCF